MTTEKITIARAEDEIRDTIEHCDGETLAEIYRQCFGAVKTAEWVDGTGDKEGHILVTYEEGLGPQDVP